MSENMNAMVRVISATLAEVVNENVDGECRHQLVQTAKLLVDSLEQATRVTQQTVTVQNVLELPETVNPVPDKTVEDVVNETVPQAPPEPVAHEVVQEPVKATDDLKLVRNHDYYAKHKWYLPGVVNDTITEKPEYKKNPQDIVNTVVSTDIMGRLFDGADKIELHYEEERKQGKKEYGVIHSVEIPIDELIKREWKQKKVSGLHKYWYQNYKTDTGRLIPVLVEMYLTDKKKKEVRMDVMVAGYRGCVIRKKDGVPVMGVTAHNYSEKEYEFRKLDEKDFARMVGVQTVWDARNLK